MGKKSREKLQRLINYRLCPGCGYQFKHLTTFRHATADEKHNNSPRPLDYAICPECIQILRFDEAGELRLPTGKDLDDLKEAPSMRRTLFHMLGALNRIKAGFGPLANAVWGHYVRDTLTDGKPLTGVAPEGLLPQPKVKAEP